MWQVKKEILCTIEVGSTFLLLLVSWQEWEIISWARFSARYLIESTIMPIFQFWDFGQIMERRSLILGSMGFSTSPWNYWSIEYHHAVYWNFGTLAGSWPLKPMVLVRTGSKLGSMGFFNVSMKFLIDRVPSCRILQFWDFGRIRE
jgi:hypothetical protein